MSRQDQRYQVNLFRPKDGQMRDEVIIIFIVLVGWAAVTFGFQILLALSRNTGIGDLLTKLTLFNLPLHFWFTGQFLPLWFIILCLIFNVYIDRITAYHSRKRDRTYE
jgi:putative solute:sodium symporter small subunit